MHITDDDNRAAIVVIALLLGFSVIVMAFGQISGALGGFWWSVGYTALGGLLDRLATYVVNAIRNRPGKDAAKE